MNFFFDNCTSPALAGAIDGLLQHSDDEMFGQSAVHIRNCATAGLPIGAHAKDVEWIEALGRDRREWIVVTADSRIRKVPAEREAFRRARLKGFLLESAYLKMKVHEQASTLLWRWPELVDIIGRFEAPTLIGLGRSRSGKLKPLQW